MPPSPSPSQLYPGEAVEITAAAALFTGAGIEVCGWRPASSSSSLKSKLVDAAGGAGFRAGAGAVARAAGCGFGGGGNAGSRAGCVGFPDIAAAEANIAAIDGIVVAAGRGGGGESSPSSLKSKSDLVAAARLRAAVAAALTLAAAAADAAARSRASSTRRSPSSASAKASASVAASACVKENWGAMGAEDTTLCTTLLAFAPIRLGIFQHR